MDKTFLNANEVENATKKTVQHGMKQSAILHPISPAGLADLQHKIVES